MTPVRRPFRLLILALVLCFVGGLGSSAVKTAGFSLDVEQISIRTASGHQQTGQLFVPPNATAQAPAPAVVVAHGGSLNSEYSTLHYIELARRGYVVYAIDMYGHGNSDTVSEEEHYDGAYDGVRYVASLPSVDRARIGITGNSNGSFALHRAVALDNAAPERLITSVLYVVNDPLILADQTNAAFLEEKDAEYTNVYGNRDVGLVMAEYDLTFNRVVREDGSVSAPRDFVEQQPAQAFLHFGKDPADLDQRVSHELYRETIDGREAIRVIDDEPIIHPWSIVDPRVAADSLRFFGASLPAPRPLDDGDQIWWGKELFGIAGVAGLLLFLVAFIAVLLRLKPFAVLATTRPVGVREVGRGGKVWFWLGSLATALVSGLAFPILFWVSAPFMPGFFGQTASFAMAMWSLFSGLVVLFVLYLNHRSYARKHGLNLREHGVVPVKRLLPKTIAVAALAVTATYGLVFVVQYFFRTDFHAWTVVGFNTFQPWLLLEGLKYLPFFGVFYLVLSVATNVFNYVRVAGGEAMNLAVNAVVNTLGALLLLGIVYGFFVATGSTPFDGIGIAVFTPLNAVIIVAAVVPIATIVMRIVYRLTGEPYLGGIVMALVATLMTVTRSLTM